MTESGYSGYQAFFDEMRQLDRIEGQTVDIERWSGAGRGNDDFAEFAREIVASNPDMIVANAFRLIRALEDATREIPIVFIAADPLGNNLVSNLARPGGNVTGVSVDPGTEFEAKRLEMLHRAAPSAKRVAYVIPRPIWEGGPLAETARGGARALGINLEPAILEAPITDSSYDDALKTAGAVDAVLVGNVGENYAHAPKIVDLAKTNGWPAIFLHRDHVLAGGLMSYAPNIPEMYRRQARYVDNILDGADPGRLPVQQPEEFDLIVNLRTARALGIEIPASLLIQTTEFIE